MNPKLASRFGTYFDWAVFGAWLALFLALTYRHIPWRDEFQSWLVSTNTPTLKNFIDALTYERTPSDLYLLQELFHALPGLSSLSPTASIQIVTGVFSIASVFLWIFRLDLGLPERYLLPFSLPFIREYSVVSRSYIIAIFFLFLGYWCFKHKRLVAYWFCLVAAAGAHPLFTLIASSLMALSVWDLREEIRKEPRKYLPPLGLVALGFLVHLWTQVPPSDSAFPSGRILADIHVIRNALVFLAFGLFGIEKTGKPFLWNYNPWSIDTALVALLVLAILAKRDKFPMGRFLFVAGGPLLVLGGIYGFAMRHAAVLFIAFVVVALLYAPRKSLLTCVMIPAVFATYGWVDLWKPFQRTPEFDQSGSRELVSSLGKELSADRAVIVTDHDAIYFSVMALQKMPVFDVRRDRFVAFPYFRRSELRLDFAGWCRTNKATAEQRFGGRELLIGMQRGRVPPGECGCVKEVFESSRPVISDEVYSVYRWLPTGSCSR